MQSAPPPAASGVFAETAPPPEAAAPAAAEALIAEAREHARRRRRRIALVTVVVAAAIGGGLVLTGVVPDGRTAAGGAPGRPLPLAARTGEVTGYLDPCVGVVLPGRPPVFAAGTVTALRGRQTWQRSGGSDTFQLPSAAPVAREHVAKNQAFALRLATGQYTLVARYDGGNDGSFINVTVRAGQVVRQDFPDICK